ncbi:MAG: hypothetical protein LBO63_04370 [Oscillospiraceae bacterium]|nr:hypothetical protein [Oscillospiraceae bacterium]
MAKQTPGDRDGRPYGVPRENPPRDGGRQIAAPAPNKKSGGNRDKGR